MVLKSIYSNWVWHIRKKKGLVPQMGEEQIIKRGHRDYVGAKWDVMGKLQFNFLLTRGLQPNHILYDIACGSLRAGVYFIPYLDKQCYCGIEKEQKLIDLGIERELNIKILHEKQPSFVISDCFEFEKFNQSPDFAIAQSLYTHLTLKDITMSLSKLHDVSHNGCLFYATFDEENITPKSNRRKGLPNPPWSHSNLTFYYNKNEIKKCGEKTGWKFEYIGDWGHPNKQQMVLFYL